MSTPAVVEFIQNNVVDARVYVHFDGNLVGEYLKKFFEVVKQKTQDTRFGDSIYLSARFVRYMLDDVASTGVGIVIGPVHHEYLYKVVCTTAEMEPEVHEKRISSRS